ncbi:MAG: methyltransferase domain-containing protein [Chloroflexi bacterium]|nr:methyltransferase domain-containing protein [Chloroflexota bacterium]
MAINEVRSNASQGNEDFSFAAFASVPFYQKINTDLVVLSSVHPGQRVVDLACGTGGVTKIILERLRGARESLVIGVDLSTSALKQARSELGNAKDAMVQFVQGRAEQLSQLVRDKVDAVVFCNAIHLVPDKEQLAGEVYSTLRSGGIFAFNTSFYAGGHPPETEQWYRRWMFRSLRILRSEYGLSPIKAEKVEARQHLSAEQYAQILRESGFQIREQRVNTVQVPLEGWVLISQFEDWITGVMPGVPLKEASSALQKGAAEVFEEMKVSFIPRNWLEVVAVKP